MARGRRIRKPPQPIDLRKTAYIRGVTAPFSWQLPYAWPRKPVLARNVVATSQPLAAQAGLQVMADGGNAVDAIVATAVTLTLVEPVSNGIGSDAFAIVWDGTAAAWAERVGPLAGGVDAGVLRRRRCAAVGLELRDGAGRGVGVGGAARQVRPVAVPSLFEPAIALRPQRVSGVADGRRAVGRAGAAVGVAAGIRRRVPAQRAGADARRTCSRFPEHAATLEKIAATNGEAFYRGELAEAMEAHARANGGAMLASDLADHRADWVDTIAGDYRGYTVHEIPPNGQGIVALIALGILENFDMAALPVDSADSLHLQIEAVKLAFADAQAYVADPDSWRCARASCSTRSTWRTAREADRLQACAAGGRGHAYRRHGVPHRCRRERDDGVDDSVELHGVRLGRGGAGHGDLAAEPRRALRVDAGASESGRPRTSVRITRSFPASCRRMARR